MIGIGVTTYNRPNHLALFRQKLDECTDNFTLHIADDSVEQRGIAFRKNECLRALRDCEHVFLFDDDCFPINQNWVEFFLKAAYHSGENHFLYLKETPTIKKIFTAGDIDVFNNCGGAFMYINKKVIDRVGAFNPSYGLYGYEHAGYTRRINKAGLTSLGEYLSPVGVGKYLYAMDYDNYLPYNKQVAHRPSLTDINLVGESIKNNFEVYKRDTEIYLPL